MKRALSAVAVCLAAAACSTSTNSARPGPTATTSPKAAAGPTACTPGINDHGSYRTQDYCGAAVVDLVLAGKKARITGGTCLVGQRFVSVTIGRRLLGPAVVRQTGSPSPTPTSTTASPGATGSPTASATPRPTIPVDFFALLIGRTPGSTTGAIADKAGTYPAGNIVVTVAGDPYPVGQSPVTQVILGPDRRTGTFRGSLLLGGAITGSFSCGPA